ncbi:ATP-binding cassette domain-containing protein [Mycolicibacterium pulveris]|uniref:ATP-binding cassette domain-containing protein n=1 Tax=Mycolicibacterium pulveris TaxID=36813 RepID=UPI003CF8CD78
MVNPHPVAQLRGLTVDIATRHGNTASEVRVLDAVHLSVHPGRVTALIGESGCGKSLAALALCGLLPPGSQTRGEIVIDGVDLAGADERSWRQLRGAHIGFVPQSAATSFTAVRTIGSQLSEVCRRLDADRGVDELLAAVHLPAGTADRYPHELSGGMAQRAAIAAAIAARPKALLADEPTSALDPDNADLVWQLLGEAAAAGAGVLVITHELPGLLRSGLCDDIALMRDGTVVQQDTAATVTASEDPYVQRFFAAAVP